jgi:hypothetical protein
MNVETKFEPGQKLWIKTQDVKRKCKCCNKMMVLDYGYDTFEISNLSVEVDDEFNAIVVYEDWDDVARKEADVYATEAEVRAALNVPDETKCPILCSNCLKFTDKLREDTINGIR